MASYGEKVTISGGEVAFLDFALRYQGRTRVTSPVYPQGFVYENFTVTANGKDQAVRWSSGTGDIGPTAFVVRSKTFWLEMSMSDTLGHLRDDEIVVRPAPAKNAP